MTARRSALLTAALVASALLVACSSDSDDATSTQTTSTPSTTTTELAATTSAAPTTTELAATASGAPATTVTAPAAGPLPADEVALVVVSTPEGSPTVSVHSARDGSRTTATDLGGEAWFAYDPSLVDAILIVNSNFEDSWFSCEGYNGIVQQVGTDGSTTELAEGELGQLDADASHLLYGRASTCGPDAVDPGNWVHAPLDTIVWRDLPSGQEQAWTFPGAVLDSETRSPITSLALAGDHIAAVVTDRLLVFDPAVGSPNLDAAPMVEQPDDELVELLGARPDGTVVGIRRATSQSGARLVEIDPATGSETEIASYPNHTLAALSRSGTDLAVFTDGVLTVNGNEIVLDGVDPGTITSIGW